MGKPAVVVDHLWKRYHKRFGTSTLWSLFGRRERTDDEFWALKDVLVRGAARRMPRHHRPERQRQEHASEDPQPHHQADARTDRGQRPRRQHARGRHRLPSRPHRAREYLPQRRRPGHEAGGDQEALRRDRRLQRRGGVHRRARQALQLRHVRAPGFRRRGAHPDRHPHHGRGPRRRRRGVPEQVPRQNGERRQRGPHRALRQPQHGGDQGALQQSALAGPGKDYAGRRQPPPWSAATSRAPPGWRTGRCPTEPTARETGACGSPS